MSDQDKSKLREAKRLIEEVMRTLDRGVVVCGHCGTKSAADRDARTRWVFLAAAAARVEKVAAWMRPPKGSPPTPTVGQLEETRKMHPAARKAVRKREGEQ